MQTNSAYDEGGESAEPVLEVRDDCWLSSSCETADEVDIDQW